MVTKVNSVNRTRKSMNERTRRECANSRKVRNLKRDEEFDENINEGRATHTWGITYKDKYNKTKQHVIDAPDAYDAKMKARRELGIKFSDIDDAEMIENLEEDTINNGFSEFRKAYMDAANKFLETLDEYGYSAQFSPNNDYYTVFDNNKSIGERHPIAYITLKMEK